MHFTFKKIDKNDTPLLLTWFEQKHVKIWWPVPEKDETIKQFLQRIRSKNTFGYIVKANKTPIGYIQYYYIDRKLEKTGSWLPALPKTTIGTDQLIGNQKYTGKGYGTLFIKEFINYLHKIEPNATTVIVDPDPTNFAAIRCYEKVGFKHVGIYETPWGPALLMRYDINESNKS